MFLLKSTILFIITAVFEILGCYLPYLVLKQGKPVWLLVPAVLSLSMFAWMLTLHQASAGRTYVVYVGVYVLVALFWMWIIEGVKPDMWDLLGAGVILAGSAIIIMAPHKN